MDNNFLFKWIWRFNALAVAVLLSSVGATVFVPRLFNSFTGGRAPVAHPPMRTPQTGQFYLRLDYARPGGNTIVYALQDSLGVQYGPSDSFSSSTPRDPNVFNYLFIDPTTGASHWLFEGHHQLIASTIFLNDSDRPTVNGSYPQISTAPVRAVLYDIVPGGDAPNGPRKYKEYASKPDGTILTELVADADEEPLVTVLEKAMIVVDYKTNGRLMVATFSMADFKPIMHKDITDQRPNPPQPAPPH